MIAMLAKMNESTWGWWHQLGWGWWLLVVTAAGLLAGLALYWAISFATKLSARRGTRPRDGRAEAQPTKPPRHPPHAPATT